MSFRVRLTLFFVLIVVVPMIALGVVVARLLSTGEHAKVVAQNHASAAAALADYRRLAQEGTADAQTLARDPALAQAVRVGSAREAAARARVLATRLNLARVRIAPENAPPLADVGSPSAIALGAVRVRRTGTGDQAAATGPVTIEVAETTAARFARTASVSGVHVVITSDPGKLLASTLLPRQHARYVASSFTVSDLGGTAATTVRILTDTSAAAGTATHREHVAFALLTAFLLLAFAGALLISRQLRGQLDRFLAAAKRIGGGDFTTVVPVEGDDEFAQLGGEFNKMSAELEQRLGELAAERTRLRESIQRVGATFAANLDRSALLEIGTKTVVDAVEAECGRAAIGTGDDGPLLEAARVGDLADAEHAIAAAEAQVGEHGGPAAAVRGDVAALAAPIPPRGIVSVARRGRPFGAAERELVASLARQTGISLENVDLHEQIKRQAVTDGLTGLSNRGRFQQVIAAEAAAARRFDQPLGLLMLDIDNFKRVNDSYGHQQGDLVLREVAAVLRGCSREVDEPARYGGEELAVALQQTDLAGAEAIAERVRTAVEALQVPRLDGDGMLRITVSCGVAASDDGDPIALVAAADAALYAAKRAGKNRTMRAGAAPVVVAPADDAVR